MGAPVVEGAAVGFAVDSQLDRPGLAGREVDSRGWPELDAVGEVDLDPDFCDRAARGVLDCAGERVSGLVVAHDQPGAGPGLVEGVCEGKPRVGFLASLSASAGRERDDG